MRSLLGAILSSAGLAFASGTYEKGEFALPELSAATKAYEILIEEVGKPPRPLRLPAGANTIKLSPSARPAAEFKWSYALLDERGAVVARFEPAQRTVVLKEPGPGARIESRNPQRFLWEA